MCMPFDTGIAGGLVSAAGKRMAGKYELSYKFHARATPEKSRVQTSQGRLYRTGVLQRLEHRCRSCPRPYDEKRKKP